MGRPRGIRLVGNGLLFLSLGLAQVARAQPAPAPVAPPAEVPPEQPRAARDPDQLPPAGSPPPASAPPPVSPAPGYPPPPAPSQPASYAHGPAPGAQRHDGVYLRLQAGLGYSRFSNSWSGTDRSVSGGGTALDIALGAALNPHLVIYGALIDSTAGDPESKFSGQSPDGSISKGMITGAVDLGGFGAVGVVGLGGGVAYYLDSNLFFAGSLVGSRLFVFTRNGDVAARSDVGFTLDGLVGKEWWVSDNWGLGVCGRVLLGSMKDRPYVNENVSTWKLAAFAVLFSASYN